MVRTSCSVIPGLIAAPFACVILERLDRRKRYAVALASSHNSINRVTILSLRTAPPRADDDNTRAEELWGLFPSRALRSTFREAHDMARTVLTGRNEASATVPGGHRGGVVGRRSKPARLGGERWTVTY